MKEKRFILNISLFLLAFIKNSFYTYIISETKGNQMTNAIKTKLEKLETEQLKEIAEKMNNDFSDEALLVINEVENVLLERMEESEFVEFMNKLEMEMA
jgi:hypothetical protein